MINIHLPWKSYQRWWVAKHNRILSAIADFLKVNCIYTIHTTFWIILWILCIHFIVKNTHGSWISLNVSKCRDTSVVYELMLIHISYVFLLIISTNVDAFYYKGVIPSIRVLHNWYICNFSDTEFLNMFVIYLNIKLHAVLYSRVQ
jgi:hypothetical protein